MNVNTPTLHIPNTLYLSIVKISSLRTEIKKFLLFHSINHRCIDMNSEHPDFVIMTIIQEELDAVKEVFREKEKREFEEKTDPDHPVTSVFWEMEIDGQKIFLVKPVDKGNNPASTLTTKILDYWDPSTSFLLELVEQ